MGEGILDDLRDHRTGVGRDLSGHNIHEIVSVTVRTLQLLIEGVKAVAIIRIVHQLAVTSDVEEKAELTASLQSLVETMYYRNS